MSEKRKKILYIITKGNFGGAQRYVFDLAVSLPKDRFDVVVAFGESGVLAKKLYQKNIRTIEIKSLKRDINLFLDFKTLIELIKIYLKEKPNVVHLNSSKIGGLGAFAGRIAFVPKIIFTGHGWAWNESRSFVSKAVIGFLHWLTIIFCHQVIAVSENTANQIKKLPFISKKIITIYNGIAPFETKDGFEARQNIGASIKQSLWIGTISELHKNKGLDYLIEAFSQIYTEFPDSCVVVLGTGEEKENLEKLIAEKKLQDRVYLVGFVEDAKKYLSAFDIFTLTSRTEAFPYTVLEAGLAKIPVIASSVGGIPEVIENKMSGVLTKSGDIKAISENLRNLLQDENLRKEYGQNLCDTVAKNFSQDKMVNETIVLYNQTI